jgi:hypothetical protein
LKTSLKYEYFDDIEKKNPFPISNHDDIRHKKYLKRNYSKIIIFTYLKSLLK